MWYELDVWENDAWRTLRPLTSPDDATNVLRFSKLMDVAVVACKCRARDVTPRIMVVDESGERRCVLDRLGILASVSGSGGTTR
jgi:hypothetical protein